MCYYIFFACENRFMTFIGYSLPLSINKRILDKNRLSYKAKMTIRKKTYKTMNNQLGRILSARGWTVISRTNPAGLMIKFLLPTQALGLQWRIQNFVKKGGGALTDLKGGSPVILQ